MNISVVTRYPAFLVVSLFILLSVLSGCSTKVPRWEISENVTEEITEDVKLDLAIPAKQRVILPDAVSPGFLIRISDTTDENVNGEYRIGFDGVLKLPYGVKVQTAGLTETTLKQRILQAYSEFYKATLSMKIEVVEKEYWVDVRGLIEKAGRYLVKSGSSLDELMANAGGLQRGTEGPFAKYVRIAHGEDQVIVKLSDYYAGAQDLLPQWQGGETVFFQSERGDFVVGSKTPSTHVKLLGEVREPGEYFVMDGADFVDYLVKAGGPTERSDLDNIILVRTEAGRKKSLQFRMSDVNVIPEIKGGDTIFVKSDNPSAVEKKTRVASDIAQVLTSIATLVLIFVAD